MLTKPLHPALAKQIQAASGQKRLEDYPFAERRRRVRANYDLPMPRLPVASITCREIAGPHGSIPLRVYVPVGQGPFPVLLFIHGGGFCFLDLDSYDFICQAFCNKVGCAVVSVDYRLAPENPWPAGVDDCVTAARWVATQSSEPELDSSRIVIAGDSGGGCLAAATALQLRDQGASPLTGQMLIYPVLDHYSANWPSFEQLGNGEFGLTATFMRQCWNDYLPTEADAEHPYASPCRAKRFDGLPPTFVQTAEYDMLRDEGEAFAKYLRGAGVPVQLTRCPGMNHGFWRWWSLLDEPTEHVEEACRWLNQTFARP